MESSISFEALALVSKRADLQGNGIAGTDADCGIKIRMDRGNASFAMDAVQDDNNCKVISDVAGIVADLQHFIVASRLVVSWLDRRRFQMTGTSSSADCNTTASASIARAR